MEQWHTGTCNISLGDGEPEKDVKKDEFSDVMEDLDTLTGAPLFKIQGKIEKKKERKKEKKVAKKRKEKKEASIINGTIFDDTPDDTPEVQPTEIDVVDYAQLTGFTDEEDDDEFGEILKEQRKTRKTQKTKDEIRKDFSDSLALLYNLLEDAKDFEKTLTGNFNAINKGRRIQGFSKYAADMAQAVIQARKSTADIIKEITGTKKTIYDLQNKADAKKGNMDASQNNEVLVNSYLNSVMNRVGRGNLIEQIKGAQSTTRSDPDETVSSYGRYAADVKSGSTAEYDDVMEAFRQDGSGTETSTDYDYIMNRIEDRLDNENSGFRPEDANLYIAYEKYDPKIIVKRCVDTGEWEFKAISKDNQELPGYPLPTKESAGRMTFNSDGDMCTDVYGRSYKVVSYFQPHSGR